MKADYARLYILLARESRLALVIRHGTAKSVCTLLWDRRKDQFTLGQWMRGRIDTHSCDLSPDGAHFVYTARRYLDQSQSWTVVSRTPFLKAVAYYPRRWSGGWFFTNGEYCVPDGSADPGDRESPEVHRVAREVPKAQYLARMVRDGWSIGSQWATTRGTTPLVRPAGAGWELREWAGKYNLNRGDLTVDTEAWDWAEVDSKRLVWTAQGCLWAGKLRADGIYEVKMLHDFNGMKFQALAASYPGGEPVRSPSPFSPRGVTAKDPVTPGRKKPNRSKVRAIDDDE